MPTIEKSSIDSARSHVAVIGAGPAGLMAAEVLARGGAEVTVYDRMPAMRSLRPAAFAIAMASAGPFSGHIRPKNAR